MPSFLDLAHNRRTIDQLIDTMRRRQGVIPFVGAGLSFDFGFPLWEPFLLQVAGEAACSTEVNAILHLPDTDRYERAAQEIEDRLGRDIFGSRITAAFGRDIAPEEAKEAVVRTLPEIAPGPVITTNFDRVLEAAFRQENQAFDMALWGGKDELAADSLLEDQRVLIKIHGDGRHAAERVLTSADYQRHYGSIPSSPGWPPPWNDLPLPRVLRRLFISRPVLFLGCSLDGDRTMDVMARCADQLTGIAHFAALAQPADPELQAPHEAYLAARNILPIWFPPGEFARVREIVTYVREAFTRSAAPRADPRSEQRGALAVEEDRRQERMQVWRGLASAEERRRFFDRERHSLLRDAPRDLIEVADRMFDDLIENEPSEAVSVLIGKVLALRSIGEMARARQLEAEVEERLHNLGDDFNAVDWYHSKALPLVENDPVQAEQYSRESLRMAWRLDSANSLGWRRSWNLRARILTRLGKHRLARRYVARAIALARTDRKNALAQADIAVFMTTVLGIHDRENNGRRAHLVAARTLKSISPANLRLAALIHDDLGVALQGTDPTAALVEHREALWSASQGDLALDTSVTTHLNIGWLNWSNVRRDRVKEPDARRAALRRAREHFDQALSYAEVVGDPVHRADVLAQRALAICDSGDPDRALADLDEAEAVLEQHRYWGMLGMARCNRGLVLEGLDRPRAALAAYRSAEILARRAGEQALAATARSNRLNLLKRLRANR